MPITIKNSGINVKQPTGYGNIGAFFLGDIANVINPWLATLNPLGYVCPEMYGAIGDGITDDTQAWKNCIASGKIIVAVNNYLCTEPLYLDNDTFIYGWIINNTTDGIKISGKTNKNYVVQVRATQEQAQNQYIGVEIINCTNCKFDCRADNYYIGFKMTGDSSGCAYNNIDSCFIVNSKHAIYLEAKNSGWCNENYFYNMRGSTRQNSAHWRSNYGVTLIKDGNPTHNLNSNHFLNMSFENSYCAINVLSGTDNTFENVRTENCTYCAIFSSETLLNIIWAIHGVTVVTDDGTNNVIADNQKIVNLFST